jgi:hypothetical protein
VPPLPFNSLLFNNISRTLGSSCCFALDPGHITARLVFGDETRERRVSAAACQPLVDAIVAMSHRPSRLLRDHLPTHAPDTDVIAKAQELDAIWRPFEAPCKFKEENGRCGSEDGSFTFAAFRPS